MRKQKSREECVFERNKWRVKREIWYGFSLFYLKKVLTLLFFSLSKQHRNPSHEQKKETHTEKKKTFVILYLLRALVVAKEKRDERDARKSSSSYSSPFTVLARCHASFRHGFFERVSERNFKSSRVSNVSVRFICFLSSSPFLVLRVIIVCTRCALSSRILSLSLSLSLKTETKDAL